MALLLKSNTTTFRVKAACSTNTCKYTVSNTIFQKKASNTFSSIFLQKSVCATNTCNIRYKIRYPARRLQALQVGHSARSLLVQLILVHQQILVHIRYKIRYPTRMCIYGTKQDIHLENVACTRSIVYTVQNTTFPLNTALVPQVLYLRYNTRHST